MPVLPTDEEIAAALRKGREEADAVEMASRGRWGPGCMVFA
jgi:hypothetical protein